MKIKVKKRKCEFAYKEPETQIYLCKHEGLCENDFHIQGQHICKIRGTIYYEE